MCAERVTQRVALQRPIAAIIAGTKVTIEIAILSATVRLRGFCVKKNGFRILASAQAFRICSIREAIPIVVAAVAAREKDATALSWLASRR